MLTRKNAKTLLNHSESTSLTQMNNDYRTAWTGSSASPNLYAGGADEIRIILSCRFSFLAQNLGVVRRMRRGVLDEGEIKLPFWSKNVWPDARKRHDH